MEKTGRNDPCPCGSGKKYKKCCLPKHEAQDRERAFEQQAAREERAAAHRASLREARARMLAGVEDDLDELTAASNAAVDLIHAGCPCVLFWRKSWQHSTGMDEGIGGSLPRES
jgi:SEC-C motif